MEVVRLNASVPVSSRHQLIFVNVDKTLVDMIKDHDGKHTKSSWLPDEDNAVPAWPHVVNL